MGVAFQHHAKKKKRFAGFCEIISDQSLENLWIMTSKTKGSFRPA